MLAKMRTGGHRNVPNASVADGIGCFERIWAQDDLAWLVRSRRSEGQTLRQTIALAMLASVSAWADVSTTKADGGSVTTVLSPARSGAPVPIAVNDNSTLRREWVVVHDSGLPVDIVGTPGVKTAYERGRYKYEAEYTISAAQPIAAVEVNFILFDVWGIRTKTLSATDVEDFAVGEHSLDASWRAFSENEVSEYYASVGYVAAVRTKAGVIFTANTAAVVDVAREYMEDFTDDLLETDPPKE